MGVVKWQRPAGRGPWTPWRDAGYGQTIALPITTGERRGTRAGRLAGETQRARAQGRLVLPAVHPVGAARTAQDVQVILCFEASRLSRNSKDWAKLFEICGHLNTLVADLDQVYDLALPDDRLILGVKGSVSEYELSLFRQRSQQAIVAKATRGALTFTLPAGLSWTLDGQIELHPDRRVQHAIRLVLDKLSVASALEGLLRGGA